MRQKQTPPGPLGAQTAPDVPGPLGAAIADWEERHKHRWQAEACGIRAPVIRPQYVGTPGGAQWWPMPSEVRPCCLPFEEKLRRADKWPMTEALFRHCRSYEHIAQRHDVNAKELRDAIRARRLTAVLAASPGDDVPF